MLKEVLFMILGAYLIFCINYIQRKLKRCFSRAQHFYAYTPLANPLWKTWTILQVLCLVWFGAEAGINCLVSAAASQKASEAGLKDRWGATVPPQTTVPKAATGPHHRDQHTHTKTGSGQTVCVISTVQLFLILTEEESGCYCASSLPLSCPFLRLNMEHLE